MRMNGNLRFKKLTFEKGEAFRNFIASLDQKTYDELTNIPREDFADVMLKQWNKLCAKAHRKSTFVLGYVKAEIISFGILTVNKDGTGEIDGLVVRSDLQGQGFGSRTLEHLLDQARALTNGTVYLNALAGNPKVIRFYQHRGFEIEHYAMLVPEKKTDPLVPLLRRKRVLTADPLASPCMEENRDA